MLEKAVLSSNLDKIYRGKPLPHILIELGYPVTTLEKAVKRMKNVNAVDSEGSSALHIAVCYKDPVEKVRVLFESGADQSIENYQGITPLVSLLHHMFSPLAMPTHFFTTETHQIFYDKVFLFVIHGYPMHDPKLILAINNILCGGINGRMLQVLSLFFRFGFDMEALRFNRPCKSTDENHACDVCDVRRLTRVSEPVRLQLLCVRKIRSAIKQYKSDGRSIFFEIAQLGLPKTSYRWFSE